MHLNIEIKARNTNPALIQQILEKNGAEFKGIDHQVDTYFQVPNGRLKLREGNIENALIHYQRTDQSGPKRSDVILYTAPANPDLKAALAAAVGVKVIVDKERAIYFIDNVKFHIDNVKGLGSFIEIEAIDTKGNRDATALQNQCEKYMTLFGIQQEDLIEVSYSDLISLSSSRN